MHLGQSSSDDCEDSIGQDADDEGNTDEEDEIRRIKLQTISMNDETQRNLKSTLNDDQSYLGQEIELVDQQNAANLKKNIFKVME